MTDKGQTTVYTDFAADFMTDRLANLCEPEYGVQTGPFGSQLHQKDYVAIGTPIITVEHLGENRIEHENIPCVSDIDRERLSKYRLSKGDIVFSRVGSVDRRALVREAEDGWLFSGRCLRVRPDQAKIDSIYLSYFFGLPAFKEHIRSIAVGATMPSLNTYLLCTVPIYYPPLPEQRAIASILGALDDKIELNRQMNHTLEAMVQGIFKSWFVDFDPVNAKAEGRKPYGMSDEVATLFPSHFVESELGPIPKGWGVNPIGELARIVGGSTPHTEREEYWKGGRIHWATPRDLANLPHPILIDTERRITEMGLGQISSHLLPQGTVLLSSRAPIGYIAIADLPLAINQGFIAIVCNEGLPNYYVLNWLRENMDVIESRANGTTFLEISKMNFRPIPAIVPPKPVIDAFIFVVKPAYDYMTSNIRESRILASIRDTLLPKLLSGEIRVKLAEKLVEQAI